MILKPKEIELTIRGFRELSPESLNFTFKFKINVYFELKTCY